MSIIDPEALKSIKLQSSSDSGISNSDNITNNSNPVIEIILSDDAEPGATIKIYDTNNNVLQEYKLTASDFTNNSGDNTVYITLSNPLSEGTNLLKAGITNRYNIISPYTEALEITLDTENFDNPIIEIEDGSIVNGGTTDDLTPVISGTVSAYTTVIIKDAGVVIATVTSDEHGKYKFIPTTDFSLGSHIIVVYSKDVAGNLSQESTISFTIVTTVAPITTIEIIDDYGSTTGSLLNNTSTDDNTPTIKGTAEAGTDIYIKNGSTLLAVVIVDSNGNYSYTPSPAFVDGNYSITITNGAGVSVSDTINFTIDTTAPDSPTSVDINTGNDSILNKDELDNTVEVSVGIPTTADIGDIVQIDANGDGTIDATHIIQTGEAGTIISITLPSGVLVPNSSGEVKVDVSIKDPSGNLSGSISTTVVTDLFIADAPDVNVDLHTNDSTPIISIDITSLSVGDILTIYDTSVNPNNLLITYTVTGLETNPSSFSIELTTNLSDGLHTLASQVSDAAGNISSLGSQASVNIDTVKDPITINDISSDGIINSIESNQTLEISGNASGIEENQDVTILFNGKTYTTQVDANGNYSLIVPVSEVQKLDENQSPYSIEVSTKDLAGNISTNSVNVIVDTSGNDISLDLNNDSGLNSNDFITNDLQVNVSGVESTSSWRYTTDAGLTWTEGSGSTFNLEENKTY